ncbi:TPA: type II toxin-antitoxin system PemK/MazF family toxin [Enterobacter cloacae]|uniref:type II toxin-antitoxin system PemK/MazF family toxin n=1 Tax=Enterobacter cloacae complex TaxID=354276 RepID=UPI00077BC8D2|nr:type II toxin-antitoxin system PemK/MazF family toxin [Enterobacter cloacae]HBM7665394.1 type II toxin-antitoxin system PemK/MazF family toxin [Enterobacter cloacae subsp. cloacae]MCK6806470.1 type II toxin-antitoxin system PemK/MazF family toxin [Enterobacter cloacae]MCK6827856.1 type II toxin-antitoxin system PemK/MazF family toxin [Enterobacter cloacae]MCM7171694.1 type II toxin-antitoxin system PemK/MazF family toxin [Enterobacter cloacae]MDT0535902.1 type II toxin-antitoxin system PemK
MDRGEIWLVSLDPIASHEQSGKRPVLIVSKASFNKVIRLPVVVPVTSGGNFARIAGFTVSLDGAGTKTMGVIRCDQPRTIDIVARNGKRLERVPDAVVNEVLARLDAILS